MKYTDEEIDKLTAILQQKIAGKSVTFEEVMLFDSIARIDILIDRLTNYLEQETRANKMPRERAILMLDMLTSIMMEKVNDPTFKGNGLHEYLKSKIDTLKLLIQYDSYNKPLKEKSKAIPTDLLKRIYPNIIKYMDGVNEKQFIECFNNGTKLMVIDGWKTYLIYLFRRIWEKEGINYDTLKPIFGTKYKYSNAPNEEKRAEMDAIFRVIYPT